MSKIISCIFKLTLGGKNLILRETFAPGFLGAKSNGVSATLWEVAEIQKYPDRRWEWEGG